MSDYVTVARTGDLEDDSMIPVTIGGTELVLARCDGAYYALEDRCSHEDFALSSGELAGCEITCILHGARFDLATGAPRALPAVMPVKTFEVRVQGDEIQVRLPN